MLTATLKSKFDEDICLLFQAENYSGKYLCDCGFASELTVKDCREVEAIFISHTHIDHFIGFDNVMRHQLAVGRKVTICGPKGIAKNVQAKLLAYNWILLEADEHAVWYEIREILEDKTIDVYELRATRWELHKIDSFQSEVVYDNGVFQAKYVLLDHKVWTVAYLFQEPQKIKMNMQNCPYPAGAWIQQAKQKRLAIEDWETEKLTETLTIGGEEVRLKTIFEFLEKENGFRLGYIMDHQASEENHAKIKALFYEADEVYIESYYAEDEAELAWLNHHSTAKASAQIMKAAKVKRAIPVHFSRRHHDETAMKALKDCFFKILNES